MLDAFGLTEPELTAHHARALVGAILIAEGLRDLNLIRRMIHGYLTAMAKRG